MGGIACSIKSAVKHLLIISVLALYVNVEDRTAGEKPVGSNQRQVLSTKTHQEVSRGFRLVFHALCRLAPSACLAPANRSGSPGFEKGATPSQGSPKAFQLLRRRLRRAARASCLELQGAIM